jgi:hypothetical protein
MVDGNVIEMDEPNALKQRYQQDGRLPTLEEVFMAATGSSFEDAELAAERKSEEGSGVKS